MDELTAVTRPIIVPPAPPPSSPAAARTMRANRRRDTAPELAVRRELWRRGHRYCSVVCRRLARRHQQAPPR